jgi:hypothetical protein
MNVDELITKNKLLEEELHKTKDELQKTKAHLKIAVGSWATTL